MTTLWTCERIFEYLDGEFDEVTISFSDVESTVFVRSIVSFIWVAVRVYNLLDYNDNLLYACYNL